MKTKEQLLEEVQTEVYELAIQIDKFIADNHNCSQAKAFAAILSIVSFKLAQKNLLNPTNLSTDLKDIAVAFIVQETNNRFYLQKNNPSA